MHSLNPRTTDSANDRILVVLDVDDPERTFRAVVQETNTSETEFHLLMVYPTAEYEERRRERIDADVPGPYTIDHLSEDARRIAQRVGREYLGPDAAGFEAKGAVGDKRDCIREAAREHEYTRVFVAEQPDSMWQQLLGVENLSTKVTRALPDVVSVVSVDDVVASTTGDSDSDVVFDRRREPTSRSQDT